MFVRAERLREELQSLVAEVDPDCYDGPGAVRMLETFTAIAKLADAGKVLMTRRIEYTRAWKREGDRGHAHFVARKTGTSVAQAVTTVQTARRLDDLGALETALRDGELSEQEAGVIADAASADPHAEKGLLAAAVSDGFAGLRDECRRVKAAARDDEVAHYDVLRMRRFLRTWTDDDGAGRGEWKLTPDAQASKRPPRSRPRPEQPPRRPNRPTPTAPTRSCAWPRARLPAPARARC